MQSATDSQKKGPFLRRDKGAKWPKSGKMAILDPFFGQFSHFSAILPLGPESIFRPFFPHFGPEARNGVCTGQSGSQPKFAQCSLVCHEFAVTICKGGHAKIFRALSIQEHLP